MTSVSDIKPKPVVIVVAEDEWLVRQTIIEALTEEGFQVIEAEHAGEALAMLKLKAADIHVLFTDVQMPGSMDGLTLAHHTRDRWPWIAVLITSGAPPPRGTAQPASSRFLSKSYAPSHVIAHVRELIAA